MLRINTSLVHFRGRVSKHRQVCDNAVFGLFQAPKYWGERIEKSCAKITGKLKSKHCFQHLIPVYLLLRGIPFMIGQF